MRKITRWQLQDAKNRLSEVVNDAVRGQPQIITRRGADVAVVLSFEEWTRLSRRGARLIDVLRRAPRVRGGLEIARPTDTGRDIDL